MNQKKIGKFIGTCRREAGMTQMILAEKLGITDRAVSKWENGKSMPDASLMIDLCNLLKINVNELLSGERLSMDNYKEMAEENLVLLKRAEELNNKKLLSLEVVIGCISTISFIALVFAASFAVTSSFFRVVMILIATAILVVGIAYCLRLEHDAGYYECPNCEEIYVPSLKAVVLAPHIGRKRKMRCPYCHKFGYHKKMLTK